MEELALQCALGLMPSSAASPQLGCLNVLKSEASLASLVALLERGRGGRGRAVPPPRGRRHGRRDESWRSSWPPRRGCGRRSSRSCGTTALRPRPRAARRARGVGRRRARRGGDLRVRAGAGRRHPPRRGRRAPRAPSWAASGSAPRRRRRRRAERAGGGGGAGGVGGRAHGGGARPGGRGRW